MVHQSLICKNTAHAQCGDIIGSIGVSLHSSLLPILLEVQYGGATNTSAELLQVDQCPTPLVVPVLVPLDLQEFSQLAPRYRGEESPR